MKTIKLYITSLLILLSYASVSQIDTEFWMAVPEMNDIHHNAGNPVRRGAPGIFRFTTFDLPAQVTLSLPADPSFAPRVFNIPPHSTYSYEFWRPDIDTSTTYNHNDWCTEINNPSGCADLNHWSTDLPKIENVLELGNISNRGVLIKSDNNITCYFEIGAFYNREIIALKGENALGTDFYVPFQMEKGNYGHISYKVAPVYSSIQIVATQDGATDITVIPTEDVFLAGGTVVSAGTPINRTLTKGQVFTAVPYDDSDPFDISRDKRLGGTRVTSTNDVAIITSDDLVHSGSGVDFIADQIVPNDILGYEYVVMKGVDNNAEVSGLETAYIYATQDNTTVTITDADGAVNHIINAGEYVKRDLKYTATHITSGSELKPISVFHITTAGYNMQMAGSILPPINKCTGSFEVAINRSDPSDFTLLLLVRNGAEGGFLVDGVSGDINGADFNPIPVNPDWKFAIINASSFIALNQPVVIKNTEDMFHFGIINGGHTDAYSHGNAPDCFYGYFSDFNESVTGASIGAGDGQILAACLGDTIQLKSSGGKAYLWESVGNQDTTLSDPLNANPTICPDTIGNFFYKVYITPTCGPLQVHQVIVSVKSRVIADFSTDKLSCCWPQEIRFQNESQNASDYVWDFGEGDLFYGETPPDKVYENLTDVPVQKVIGLTSQSQHCGDYAEKIVTVNPKITGRAKLNTKTGCNEYIYATFDISGASGPFTRVHWKWGDGTEEDYPRPADPISEARYDHTYTNLTDQDVSYTPIAYFYDDLNICVDTVVVDTVIKVPGVARANFTVSDSAGCSPHTVDFTNTNSGSAPAVTYTWNFGNGSEFNSPTDPIDVTFTYTNNTKLPKLVPIKMEVRRGDCVHDTTKYITIHPKPETSIDNAIPIEGCNPLNVDFSQTTVPDIATKFDWDFGDGSSSSKKDPAPKDFVNQTPLDTTFKVRLITTSDYNCKDTASIDVSVYSYVDAKFTLLPDTAGCSPLSLEIINNSSSFSYSGYEWDISPSSGDSPINTAPFNITFENVGDATEYKTIELRNKNPHNCKASLKKTITVFPEITANYYTNIIGGNTVCAGDKVQFYDSSYYTNSKNLIALASYQWNFGDGTSSALKNPQKVFKNETSVIKTYNITLQITLNECTQSFTNQVNVYPQVKAMLNTSEPIVCSPEIVEIQNNSIGAALYTWTFLDSISTPQSNTSDPIYNYNVINPSEELIYNYRVVLEASTNNCVDKDTINISVHPEIKAAIAPDVQQGCSPLDVNWQNTTTGGNLSYDWDFHNGEVSSLEETSILYYNLSYSDTIYKTRMIASNAIGCSDTAYSQVTVFHKVQAKITTEDYNVCTPKTIQLQNLSEGADDYLWTFKDSISTNSLNETTSASTFDYVVTNPSQDDVYKYTVILEVSSNNCTDIDSLVLTAYPELVADFVIDKTDICAPDSVRFTNKSVGAIVETLWDFKNDETSYEFSPDYVTYQNKTPDDLLLDVFLTVGNDAGCKNTATHQIKVFPEINPKFTFTKFKDCSKKDTVLLLFQNNSLNGDTFFWDFGFDNNTTINNNSSFSYTFYHTNSNPNSLDSYDIQLLVLDSEHPQCNDSITKTVKILPPVIANFSFTENRQCAPAEINFSDYSTGYKLNYDLEYGDGENATSTINGQSYIYENLSSDSVFTAFLTVSDSVGCTDTISQRIVVYPQVVADFSFEKQGNCTPLDVNFDYPSGAINGKVFTWDFGDGTTETLQLGENVTHTYKSTTNPNLPEVLTINLHAVDEATGCYHDTSKTIKIYPILVPDFTTSDGVFEGCNPLPIQFVNKTKGGDSNLSYYWDYDNDQSSSEVNPFHLFKHTENSTQAYNVKLVARNTESNCVDSISKPVSVYSYLLAKFGITDTQSKSSKEAILGGCSPFSVHVIDSSKSNNLFIWEFQNEVVNDINATSNIDTVLTYENLDESVPLDDKLYTIKLVVENNEMCRDSIKKKLKVYPNPIAEFEMVDSDGLFCNPADVTFVNNSISNNNYSYEWEPGDGTVIFEKEFTSNFVNLYHTKDTIYDVELRVISDHYCADTANYPLVIHPTPFSIVDIYDDKNCSPFIAQFYNNSVADAPGNSVTFNWDFDGGEEQTGTNEPPNSVKVKYVNKTDNVITKMIKLYSQSEFLCTSSDSARIQIYPEVTADFITDPVEGCSPLAVNFENLSHPTTDAGAKTFDWVIDEENEVYTTEENPANLYINTSNNDKTYDIKLTAKSIYNCQHDTTKSIKVFLTPNADFDVYLLDGSSVNHFYEYPDNSEVQLKHNVIDGPWEFQWTYGDGNSSTNSETHNHTYEYWGPAPDFKYQIKLYVKNTIYGCDDIDSTDVFVFAPKPVIEIKNDTISGCIPLEVNFDVFTNYAPDDSIFWDFGDGSPIVNEKAPYHKFDTAGIFVVKAQIRGDGGVKFSDQLITVYALPEPSFKFYPSLVMLPDAEVQFINTTVGDYDWLWAFDDGVTDTRKNPLHTYTGPLQDPDGDSFYVSLTATSANNCVATYVSDSLIRVKGEGYIKFPNTFLPVQDADPEGAYVYLADQENSVFHPHWAQVKKYELWIFNRWGEQIFYSDDIKKGWNGRYGNSGKDLGQDVYFWKAKGTFENDVPFKKAGDITLIRLK